MSDDNTPSPGVTAHGSKLLQALFTDNEAGFRHHMGLVRSDTHEFFAPTRDGAEVLAERLMILSSPDSARYFLTTTEGEQAFKEFANFVGAGVRYLTVLSGVPTPRTLGLNLEPDWLLLAPSEWRIVAACVCFPTRWSLEGKALARLADIHGVVPQLNEELGRKIEMFFSKVKPGEGWGRANWGLSSSAKLNQHPSLPYEPLREDHPLGQIQVRVEQQHLCKLPRTGAISFGIRVLNYPLAEVLERPMIRAGLVHQLQTMPAEVAHYKGIPLNLWRRF